MVLNVGGWREVCCGVVREGGGEGGLLWYCVWRGREVCRGVVRRGMEVCCIIVCGKMEGGLLWC